MLSVLGSLISNFKQYSSAISERGKVLETGFMCSGADIPNPADIIKMVYQFPQRDLVKLTLCTITDERVSIHNQGNNVSEEELEAFFNDISADDQIDIKISIDKSVVNNTMSVYNFQAFSNAILEKGLVESMSIFNNLLGKQEYVVFELFDSSILFSTSTMLFKSADLATVDNSFKRNNKLELIKQASYFYNFKEYELIPDDFNLITNCAENPFRDLFSSIKTVLSIAFISNSSFIEKSILNAQITGQRSVSFSYNLEGEKIANEELFKIYNWIYTDGNPVDKSIIARNIISLHCKYTDLVNTDEKTFASIQSNFAVYQKNNASQYIELKNKLAEYITNLVSQSGDIILSIIDRLKNNAIAIFTFIFTVTLTNTVSKSPLQNIFTKDITVLFYLILLFSIAYMAISIKEVNYKLRKMEEGYDALKNNYRDLLDDTDLLEIFQRDDIINQNIKEVKDFKLKIFWCWGVIIAILFIAIEYISTSPLLIPVIKNIFIWFSKLLTIQ